MMDGDMTMMREHIDRGDDFEDEDKIASSKTYKAGDVIGCAVDFISRTTYVTKNGISFGTCFNNVFLFCVLFCWFAIFPIIALTSI